MAKTILTKLHKDGIFGYSFSSGNINLIKRKFRLTAFSELEELKKSHRKVSHNVYNSLDHRQEYIKCRIITSRQCSTLFEIRSKTVRGIREHWEFMNQQKTLFPLCERKVILNPMSLIVISCLALNEEVRMT